VEIYVRPEDLAVGEGGWPATVTALQRSGGKVRLRAKLDADASELELELPAAAPAYTPGSTVHLQVRRYGVFPRTER
jgi:sulfate transport system ATP-binding protein